MIRTRILAAITLMMIATSTASAQSGRALAQELDSIAAAGLLADKAIGAVVVVVQGNDTLLFKGYGKANVEWDVAMPTDAMFEIGSITKQFTAAAILKLRDEGKLSLDDDITKWLPDFDTHGNKVPLRRLLDHTSGITDASGLPEFRNSVSNIPFPPDSVYALIKRQPFRAPTGTAHVYNNAAYWLLGSVIQKASGISYERYIEDKIFAPLGMSRSMACSFTENVPHRAQGYRVRNGMVRRAPLNVPTWYMGAGVLCSTAGDMVIWLKALHGGKVMSPASYAEMIKPATLNDGTPLQYAMGLDVAQDARGNEFIGHSGEVLGFAARANWYPEARMAVVVLMNNSGDASPSAMAADMAAAVLPVKRP